MSSPSKDRNTYMLYDEIGFPSNQLHFEITELGVNFIEFVDDGSNSRVFLNDCI